MLDLTAILSWEPLHSLHFWRAFASIILAPLMWNVVSRFEYKTRILSKLFLNKKVACYIFAVYVFFFSLYRNVLFKQAVFVNTVYHNIIPERFALLHTALVYLLYAVGFVLVGGSSLRLKVIGTYCGDYFDIFIFKEPVRSFPFNICPNPMYVGSTILFLAFALAERSLVGLVLTILVAICYYIALLFEAPFTAEIYKQRAETLKLQ
ncbi:hypothetical protein RCL1_008377 [Eukaryota sp. TZLM3-RCL]